MALASTDGSYTTDRLTVTWSSDGPSVVLDGAAGFVLDADVADMVIVVARAERPAAFLVPSSVPGLRVDRVPTVDRTRRLFTVTFDGVRVPADPMLTDPGPASAALFERVLALGVVAAAVDATGAAEQALEATASYARERTQFGKPIGIVPRRSSTTAPTWPSSVEASRAATERRRGRPRQ